MHFVASLFAVVRSLALARAAPRRPAKPAAAAGFRPRRGRCRYWRWRLICADRPGAAGAPGRDSREAVREALPAGEIVRPARNIAEGEHERTGICQANVIVLAVPAPPRRLNALQQLPIAKTGVVDGEKSDAHKWDCQAQTL